MRLQSTAIYGGAWSWHERDHRTRTAGRYKLYWNRLTPSERQLGDAAGIVAVQGDNLDRDYLRRWAPQLDVAAALDELLTGKIRPKNT